MQDISGVEIRDERIRRMELTLLQDHVMKTFALTDQRSADSILANLHRGLPLLDPITLTSIQSRMVSWVQQFEPQVHPALMHAAREILMKASQPSTSQGINKFNSDDPVEAATQCYSTDVVSIPFARCYATFRPMDVLAMMPWYCRVCTRQCLIPAQRLYSNKTNSVSVCMFCGTNLCR